MTLQKWATTSVQENDYQLWLDSYKAFITPYFFSICATAHVTEHIMLKKWIIWRNFFREIRKSYICTSTVKIPNKNSNWHAKRINHQPWYQNFWWYYSFFNQTLVYKWCMSRYPISNIHDTFQNMLKEIILAETIF